MAPYLAFCYLSVPLRRPQGSIWIPGRRENWARSNRLHINCWAEQRTALSTAEPLGNSWGYLYATLTHTLLSGCSKSHLHWRAAGLFFPRAKQNSSSSCKSVLEIYSLVDSKAQLRKQQKTQEQLPPLHRRRKSNPNLQEHPSHWVC